MNIVVKAKLLVSTGRYYVLGHSRKFAGYRALRGACYNISRSWCTQLEGAAADFYKAWDTYLSTRVVLIGRELGAACVYNASSSSLLESRPSSVEGTTDR